VVYERAARGEERFFLDIAEEVVSEIDEPKDWKKKVGSGKHPGGRPYEYEFRTRSIGLMFMVYHREYREMEVHLRSNSLLLKELGLERAPSKSSIHSAASRRSTTQS
jgi:hypothetical protein